MKNVQLRLLLILVIAPAMLFSCSKETVDQFSSTKEILTLGKWSIDYYFDGQDNTAWFHDYEFNFNASGSFTAIRGTETFSGTWSTIRNTSSDELITIHFETSTTELDVLEFEWTTGAVSLNSVAMKNALNTQLRFHKL